MGVVLYLFDPIGGGASGDRGRGCVLWGGAVCWLEYLHVLGRGLRGRGVVGSGGGRILTANFFHWIEFAQVVQ